MILELSARLRSGTPVDARGMARLRELLTDGSGPCYARVSPDALRAELKAVADVLDVQD